MSLLLNQSLNLALILFIFPASWLLWKTTKLAFADSYIVLVANMPDLDNFRLEFFGQLKGLGASQSFSVIRFYSAAG
jgi:hypothetical protein